MIKVGDKVKLVSLKNEDYPEKMLGSIGTVLSLDTTTHYDPTVKVIFGDGLTYWPYIKNLKVMKERDNMIVFEKVKQIVMDQLGFEDLEVEINDCTRLIDDLVADSLDVVEIIMAVEEDFDIEITEDEMDKISTVGELINCVNRRIKT